MKITNIQIRNYKSIKALNLDLNLGLNAFIGENSVGKSNIFSALNRMLGKTYPTFNNISKNDHFMGDENNKILIEVKFSDGNTLTLDESQDTYNFKIANGGNKNENREKYILAYLDTTREISDYLPSNKRSLIGRILQQINNQFSNEEMIHPRKKNDDGSDKRMTKQEYFKECLNYIRDNILFTPQDQNGENIMEKFVSILQTETADQLNRPQEDFQVNFNLYDPRNFYKTLQIIVKEDNGLEFQAGDLGMGVQASISIAILKAYSELHLTNQPPIFIDEPELYLHPQAQRNFYKLLRKLTDEKDVQIFYNTHSPNFLNTSYFDEIFLARKHKENGTYISYTKIDKFRQDLQIRQGISTNNEDFRNTIKNAYDETGDSQKANEAFFAKKVLLVEGQTESRVLPYLFELVGYDYIKDGLTIVRCGCKGELDRFFRLYSEFGIPCFILFDGDKNLETQEGVNVSSVDYNKKENKNIFNLFGMTDIDYPNGIVYNQFLGFETCIEDNLGIHGIGKGLKGYKKLKQETLGGYIMPNRVSEMVSKLRNLQDINVISILQNTIAL